MISHRLLCSRRKLCTCLLTVLLASTLFFFSKQFKGWLVDDVFYLGVPKNIDVDTPAHGDVHTGDCCTVVTNQNKFGENQTDESDYVQKSVDDVLKWLPGSKRHDFPPYVPLNVALYKLRSKDYTLNKSSLISKGFGLNAYTTDEKEEAWVENGVIYRPRYNLEPAENKYYSSDFEPYIPFNLDVFFEGDPNKIQQFRKHHIKPHKKQPYGKKIILWHVLKSTWPKITDLQPLRLCPDLPCLLTSNNVYRGESSAMVVNGQILNQRVTPRTKDQVFVFYDVEPATRNHWYAGGVQKRKEWNSVFNWTMTYRLDSDLVNLYGLIRKRRKPLEYDYDEIWNQKTELVAWMVSNENAESQRNRYIEELGKYIQIHRIDPKKEQCTRDKDPDCCAGISKRYKFYIGFENSLCPDYVTEKLFKYYNLNLLVIARGANDYSDIAPKGTFINTADFQSPKQLAERLKFLGENKEEYVSLLKEKNKYFAVYENYNVNYNGFFLSHRYEAVTFCQLCQRLWNMDKYQKTIPNILDWWEQKRCHVPKDI